MRRMYSEQELTKVIKEVFEAELASGALDSKVNDAVDAYLEENPVDITALEGQDVVCNSLETDSAIKYLSKVVDEDGNARFIEGAGTPLSQEGFTSAYCRWSLSGTHIMFVLAGSFLSGITISAGQFAVFEIPEWISNKIFPVFGTSNIEVKEPPLYNADWTIDDNKPALVLQKSGNYVFIQNVASSFTTTKDRSFRVQFDLLIDMQ